MDLDFIRFLTSNPQRQLLLDHLTEIGTAPWQGMDEPSFANAFFQVKEQLALKPAVEALFERFLIAHCLTAGPKAPDWLFSFITAHIHLKSHLPEINSQTCRNGRWVSVRVPMVSGEKTRIQWFVVGRIHGAKPDTCWPPWSEPLLAEDSREAIVTAVRTVQANHPPDPDSALYLFPLALANGQCRIRGASLGLPLAIGFMHVCTGEQISKYLLATGAVEADGRVGQVAGLVEKHAYAVENETVSLLIYPAANDPLPKDGKIETLQATNFSQTWMFARWHVPGNGNRLAALAGMLTDPHAFVENMNTVEWQWIHHLDQRRALADTVAAVVSSPDLFARFVSRVEKKLDRWQLDDAETYLDLVDSSALALSKTHSPLACFRFYTAKLALANHRGEVDAAQKACREADGLFDLAKKGGLGRSVDFLNHRLVARHNRFQFEPGLPDPLQGFVTMLESRYDHQCAFGCPTDPVLARLYGTLAQNFGFCGPEHLADMIRYTGKAVEAFGGGEVPEYRQDLLRQYAYLTYAHLDAGDRTAARESLFAFLAVENWDQVRQMRNQGNLTRWHHAALARFWADAGDRHQATDYLDWCQKQKTTVEGKDHPRQLWTYNMGRMAVLLGRQDAARNWFIQSRDLCLSMENRPTILVMALLPLAALVDLDGTDRTASSHEAKTVVDTACRLNPSHFKSLCGVDEITLLKRIRETPERFFPFSYR